MKATGEARVTPAVLPPVLWMPAKPAPPARVGRTPWSAAGPPASPSEARKKVPEARRNCHRLRPPGSIPPKPEPA